MNRAVKFIASEWRTFVLKSSRKKALKNCVVRAKRVRNFSLLRHYFIKSSTLSAGVNLAALFISLFITLLIPLTALASYSEDIALLKEKIGVSAIGDCHENLVQAYDLELTEFLIFLKTNFENKSANSTLVNIAIQRYSEYKIRLQDLFALLKADVIIAGDTNQYRRELESYGNCKKVMDDYISLAKTKMIEHIKNTSSQKKTTIMMEKYRAINERLADLNMEMAHLYANFVQFKNKLPFFNKNCVTN